MWNISRFFDLIHAPKGATHRFAEMAFASGIPITGYLMGMSSLDELFEIGPMLIATGFVGWHILVVNDVSFSGNSTSRFCFGLAWCLPVLSLVLAVGIGRFAAAVCLLLMVINWNLYSVYFKKNFILTLLNNFLGGLLHFSAGILFTTSDLSSFLGYGLFFALTMMAASMHHDALDIREDKEGGYLTGAVRFGREKWWRLGIIPMILANLLLIGLETFFDRILLTAFLAYLVLYTGYSRRVMRTKSLLGFRMICRLVYAAAGGLYTVFRLFELA